MLPHERASIDERTAALTVNPPVLPPAMPHLSRPLAVLRDHSRYVPGRFHAFPLSMPACTMRGSHIVGRCACTWPPPERDFSSSCSCGLFFNAVSTGAGERSRQNARACTENASNVFWRERGRRRRAWRRKLGGYGRKLRIVASALRGSYCIVELQMYIV